MAALIAAGIALGWCLFAIWLGPRFGLVDRPDDGSLKPHARPIVPLGGVGVFAGVHAAMAAAGTFDVSLVAASGVVLVLGIADDRWSLSPSVRLATESIAGVLVGLRFFDGIGIVATAVLVVVAINAVNLFDGLDGLAGAATVVAGLGLAWLALLRSTDPTFALVLAGAASGFLILNWPPAKVFLGDNGSYVIGVFLVFGMLDPAPSMERLAPNLLLLGVFGLDLATTVLRRWRAGRSLFVGDRSHLYDQVHDRGLSTPTVSAFAAGVQALFVVAAVLIDGLTSGVTSWLVTALSGVAALAIVAASGLLKNVPPPSQA